MKLLQDYLSLFLENEKRIISKKDRKERHNKLLQWFKIDYSEYPSANEILKFVSKHNEIINVMFCDKVIIPCLNDAIDKGNVEDIRIIFEANSLSGNGISSESDFIIRFCKYKNWSYTPMDLIDLVLKDIPQDKSALYYKYTLLKNWIEYSVHEVPIGVFPDVDKKEFILEDSLRTLDDFKSICFTLGYNENQLISRCEKIYRSYVDYINNLSNYKNFEEYLLSNKIDWNI